jgi:hypothetical protein
MRKNFSISALIFSLINEQNSFELLYPNWSIIYFFKELMVYQENFLNKKKKEDSRCISTILKKIEMDRVKFLLKSYLRIRIWKLEDFIISSIKEYFKLTTLCMEEEVFEISYRFLLKSYFENLIFKQFYSRKTEQIFERAKEKYENIIIFKNDFVFFKVIKKKEFIRKNLLDVDKPTVFYKNGIYCMQLKSIKHLLSTYEIVLF